jgi:hypothetical protein
VATEWLDDAFGPDKIRVTIAVEPAVERLVRERDQWTVPRSVPWQPLMNKVRATFRAQLPAVVQQQMLHDTWAVMVEADSGQKVRLMRSTHDEAWQLATSIADSVRSQGVAAVVALK